MTVVAPRSVRAWATVAWLVACTLLGVAPSVVAAPPGASPTAMRPAAAPKACSPYPSRVKATTAQAFARSGFKAWFFFHPAQRPIQPLFDAYLTPGVESGERLDLSSHPRIVTSFRKSDDTRRAVDSLATRLISDIADDPPELQPPTDPVVVHDPDPAFGQDLPISYGDDGSAVGVLAAQIAGGVGGVDTSLGSWPDRRDLVNGTYTLVPTATDAGVLTRVSLHVKGLRLDLQDSIDFCPGNLTDMWLSQAVATAASRLENTAYPAGGPLGGSRAAYANPVLYRLSTEVDAPDRNATMLYGNDKDGDGVPDAEPWRSATYALDNCPDVSNADQADRDSNGVGDACEDKPPTHSELRLRGHFTYHYADDIGNVEDEHEDLSADIPLSSASSAGSGALYYPTVPAMDSRDSCGRHSWTTGSVPGLLQFDGLAADNTAPMSISWSAAPGETGIAASCNGQYPTPGLWHEAVKNLQALAYYGCSWGASPVNVTQWTTSGWTRSPVDPNTAGVAAHTSCRTSGGGLEASLDLQIWQVPRVP